VRLMFSTRRLFLDHVKREHKQFCICWKKFFLRRKRLEGGGGTHGGRPPRPPPPPARPSRDVFIYVRDRWNSTKIINSVSATSFRIARRDGLVFRVNASSLGAVIRRRRCRGCGPTALINHPRLLDGLTTWMVVPVGTLLHYP
jgi:hypothetical protein